MRDFRELWSAIEVFRYNGRRVPYWYGGISEPAMLQQLANRSPGDIVELGTYCGTGAACLAAGCKRGRHVYTIDPALPGWDTGNNLTGTNHGSRCPAERSIDVARALWDALGLSGIVTGIELPCEDPAALAAAPESVGLLFVDAEHQTEALRLHLSLWAPRVMPGGYLVLHDWGVPGNEAVKWDVAGEAAAWVAANGGARSALHEEFGTADRVQLAKMGYCVPEEWVGPVVVNSLAWYQRSTAEAEE